MEMCKKLIVTIATALAVSVAFAQPRTFLGPTAHLGVVKSITDDSAFALAGEVGLKNLRASGTIGWEFDYHQRVKGTAEYLRQKLTYEFYDGQQDAWVGQTALGANYQYDFRQVDPYNTLLDLSAYYSHSPSKGLGVTTVITDTTTTNVYKRIAGADAFGVSPALSIVTLDGTSAGLELNYDNVQYDTKNRSGLTVKGLGGTARLSQAITDDVKIAISAAVRRPFNNYGANINFANLDCYGVWSLNAFGDYTIGKSTLPSSYNVGLGADYFMDASNHFEPSQPQYRATPKHYKDYKDYKDLPPLVWSDPEVVDKDLLSWVAVPAVRLPEVYTVPDQKLVSVCIPPTFGPDIGDITGSFVYALTNNFQGTNLVFTFTPLGGVDPMGTVFVSGNNLVGNSPYPTGGFDLIVTATNACGSVDSNQFEVID